MYESLGEHGPVSSDVRYRRRSEHQLLVNTVSAWCLKIPFYTELTDF